MSTNSLFQSWARWSALVIACGAPLQASYISAVLNAGANGSACGSVNPIDPSEACAGAPNVSTVSLSAQYSNTQGTFDARAMTGYGLNRVYASSAASDAGAQATSEWMVVFTLTGAPVGTPVNLLLQIGYDVSIGTAGQSEAGFRMTINNNSFFPYDIFTTTNIFSADHCFDRPGQTARGACAGSHTGTINHNIGASMGPNNRLTLSVGAGAFGTGLTDAYHTVQILGITVPDGIGWQYQGVNGNPLNFHNEAGPSPVPEPAAVQLLGAGLGVLAVVFRKRLGSSKEKH